MGQNPQICSLSPPRSVPRGGRASSTAGSGYLGLGTGAGPALGAQERDAPSPTVPQFPLRGGRARLAWGGSGGGIFGVSGLSPVSPAEIREAFKVFDRDGNGFISKQELGTAMRSLGYMPNEVELEVIIQRLDMDGRTPARDPQHPPMLLPPFSHHCWIRRGPVRVLPRARSLVRHPPLPPRGSVREDLTWLEPVQGGMGAS